MITLYTLLAMFTILMQAFFTASEMAITSINRLSLQNKIDEGDQRAKRLDALLKKGGIYLAATLVGTNIAVISTSTLITRIFVEYLGPARAPFCATLVIVPIVLIFAEIIPKMVARHFALSFSLKTVSILSLFQKTFYPIITSVNFVANFIISPFSKMKAQWDQKFTKSDLKRIFLLGHETGEVDADEVEFIHNILDFSSTKVEKIMTPLYKVSSIEINDSVANLRKLVSLTGFSRIPVYKTNKHGIVGIINIYDILFDPGNEDDRAGISAFLRTAVKINAQDNVDIALTRLRHRKQPMGIVVDKTGITVGIITIEDILEEIVGELEDTR